MIGTYMQQNNIGPSKTKFHFYVRSVAKEPYLHKKVFFYKVSLINSFFLCKFALNKKFIKGSIITSIFYERFF